MKTEIHPKYGKTTIKCACGNEFETRSTVSPEIHVELCSVCHPFYTGKQKFVDTAGRVDKFQARMKKAEEVKKTDSKPKKTEDKKDEVKTNQDALKEIKKEITKAPGELTQEMNSSVDAAAESELKESKKDN